VLNQALAFEEAAIDDYRRLAEKAPAGDVRDLLIALAAEEEAHLAELRRLGTVTPPAAEPFPYEPELPGPEALIPDVSSEARELLEHAVEHELATAAFYAALAESTHITSLRRALNALAAEERAHAERLRALA
jgi:rubrerythrin